MILVDCQCSHRGSVHGSCPLSSQISNHMSNRVSPHMSLYTTDRAIELDASCSGPMRALACNGHTGLPSSAGCARHCLQWHRGPGPSGTDRAAGVRCDSDSPMQQQLASGARKHPCPLCSQAPSCSTGLAPRARQSQSDWGPRPLIWSSAIRFGCPGQLFIVFLQQLPTCGHQWYNTSYKIQHVVAGNRNFLRQLPTSKHVSGQTPHAICTFWPGSCSGSCFWIKKNKYSFLF